MGGLSKREMALSLLFQGVSPEQMQERQGVVLKPKRERVIVKPRVSEWHEQAALVTWWWRYAETKRIDVRYLFSIPNGTYLHGDGKQRAIQSAHLKSSGMRLGVPDLMLALPRKEYHGLFIEMKAIDGAPSPNQTEYHDLLMHAGYKVNVCFGAEQGIEVVRSYVES